MTHRFPLNRWRLRPLLIAFTLLAALTVVACTGDDDESSVDRDAGSAAAHGDGNAGHGDGYARTGHRNRVGDSRHGDTDAHASGEPPAFPLTIEDSDGVAVTLQAAPQRIISYSPGVTEIVFAVGAGDQRRRRRRVLRLPAGDGGPAEAHLLEPRPRARAGAQPRPRDHVEPPA